jgi:predicted CXXCH cytochrome family protein
MREKTAPTGLIILFFLNLLLSGCAAAGSAARPPQPGKPAEVKADCSLCHTATDGGRGDLRKPVPDLCRECHPDRAGSSEHKIDIVPKVVVPQLPLKEGKMTCTTCHDPHSKTYGRMLRVPGKELCTLCHKY